MGLPMHELLHRARRNGNRKGQYAGSVGINSDRVVDKLEDHVRPGRRSRIRRQVRALLELLAESSWSVSSGMKSGGLGGGGRPPDENLHITLSVQGKGGYHLQLDRREHVWRITGKGIPEIDPWEPPGI